MLLQVIQRGRVLGVVDNSSFHISRSTLNEGEPQSYVGSGGTADCFRVNRHGKWFVLKRLRAELANDERRRQAMRKEYETGIRIDHPNIVRYHYIDETSDGVCILQDYVDGLPLDQFIDRNPRYFKDKANRRRFVGELLSAVECLHQHQVLHLDLKPDNILITTNGHTVKLIDLGMSFGDAFTSTYGGTQGFSAPEILNPNGGKPTTAADIYSVGKILALTGCAAKCVINRSTSTDPLSRYQSVSELRQSIVSHAKTRKLLCALAIFAVIALPPTLFLCLVDYGGEKKNNDSEIMKVDVAHPTSDVENLKSDVGNPKSDVRISKSDIENPKSDVRISKSDIENPKSDIGKPASNNSTPLTPHSSLKDRSSLKEDSIQKLQNDIYKQIYKSIDDFYAPVLQLVANPPDDKQEFLNRFYELRAEARTKYTQALQDASDKYHMRLSEKQYQVIFEKTTAIEEKFYVRYNQDK